MQPTRARPALIAAVVLLISCGTDATSSGESATTTEMATTTTAAATTTTAVAGLEQPAIWPAADVQFDTPDEAAADFVTQVLGVGPVLGAFQQGDSRSGEIEVFSPGDGGGATPVHRGLLLLRQLGPANGWFIVAAVNDHASITSPASMAVLTAGPLTVEGMARGFESTVVVKAFVAGHAETVLDMEIAQGGAMETAPYSVVLDLSGAAPGDIVTLLVRGDAGLETDPGEFGAIPIVIAD